MWQDDVEEAKVKRMILAVPWSLDEFDAQITWWIGRDGRWANWDWTGDPKKWMEVPPIDD